MAEIEMNIIARMQSDFPTKFGIPRQSGLVKSLQSTIIFEPEYRNSDAVRGLENFSHIWIIWQFSKAVRKDWSPTVRPPRLGGNTRIGVFATRSPFRPNSIGLSSVKIEGIEHTKAFGTVIHVSGADLMNGTPILDIKPYIPYTDCHTEAIGGFTEDLDDYILDVAVDESLLASIPENLQQALLEVLSHDPRPSYQQDTGRIYGMSFGGFNIRFNVSEKTLTVHSIEQLK